MAQATMSVLGLYNYDPGLFSGLAIPAELNKNVLVNNLLMECAEFEIIYPAPGFMKSAVTEWSKTMLPIWQKLYESTQYEYNPIYNYDRYEEYTDEYGSTDTGSQQGYENSGFVDQTQLARDGNLEHTAHLYGNIGVTTTMQMIREQREIVEFNVYQKIIDDFKHRFCILIY